MMQPDILVKEEFKSADDTEKKEDYTIDNSLQNNQANKPQQQLVNPQQVAPVSINNSQPAMAKAVPNQNVNNQVGVAVAPNNVAQPVNIQSNPATPMQNNQNVAVN